MSDDIFSGYGVRIALVLNPETKDPVQAEKDAFLRIRETLTRIGIASPKTKTLFQSCHILQKRGYFAILHFKELYALDGRHSTFDGDDRARRNKIVKLLQEWNLAKVLDPAKIAGPDSDRAYVRVLHYNEKKDWTLSEKYAIGKKKR